MINDKNKQPLFTFTAEEVEPLTELLLSKLRSLKRDLRDWKEDEEVVIYTQKEIDITDQSSPEKNNGKMKTELTVEQSQHLIELGVPKGKANEVIFNPNVNEFDFVFRLTDLLQILPNVMHKEKQAYHYNLVMYWAEEEKKWRVTYDAIGDNMGSETATELIDALYELTVWCIENKHLKFYKSN